jgi:hypothetical protein
MISDTPRLAPPIKLADGVGPGPFADPFVVQQFDQELVHDAATLVVKERPAIASDGFDRLFGEAGAGRPLRGANSTQP